MRRSHTETNLHKKAWSKRPNCLHSAIVKPYFGFLTGFLIPVFLLSACADRSASIVPHAYQDSRKSMTQVARIGRLTVTPSRVTVKYSSWNDVVVKQKGFPRRNFGLAFPSLACRDSFKIAPRHRVKNGEQTWRIYPFADSKTCKVTFVGAGKGNKSMAVVKIRYVF